MWKKDKIVNLCDIQGGKPAPNDSSGAFDINGIPFVRMRDLGRYHLTTNLNETDEKISIEYALKNNLKPIPKGAILIPRSGSVALNHRAILGRDAIIVSHICALLIKDESKLNNRFLYYWLIKYDMNKIAKKTTGLDAINFSDLGNVEVSYPDLETQNKIVAILDKAKVILDKREETIRQYDELLRATFLEMFGDSVKNERDWEKKSIQNICKNIVDCPHSTPTYLEIKSDFPCIRTSEIKNGDIVWESMKYISEESYLERIARLKPEENDIIFGREGTVGEALLIPPNLNISLGQRVMLFRVDKEQINPIFFWAQMVSDGIQFEIERRIIGATVKRINIGDLVQIQFIIPPIELQNEFASRIEKILSLKRKVKTHQESGNNLLKSLSQQVFSERITIDIDAELEALINTIDMEDLSWKSKRKFVNAFKKITEDITFIQRLIDRLDEQEVENQLQYNQAKSIVFRALKKGKVIKQVYNDELKKLKLII